VLRGLVLLIALGGCDLALGLTRDDLPPVCGPFARPSEVVFDTSTLSEVRDFSVDPTGVFGMVYANASIATGAWRGPHAVKLAGTVWTQDLARDKAILSSFDGGHVISGTEAIAWIDSARSNVMVNLLTFAGMAWSQNATDVVDPMPSGDSHIGNVITLPGGAGTTIRFAPEIAINPDPSAVNEIRILQRTPASKTWAPTMEPRYLTAAKQPINPSAGVLTADHEILVYTGKIAAQRNNRMFASRRDHSEDAYFPGVEVIIDGVPTASDLTEPWINADCSQLYFRRGDITYVTEAI